ncbi:MAG TPA: polysaccharide deacetylase [Candidatus Sulfotelmatobacter sp.]|nr:polysaccharide deacetylase [Candidatus Sulfotelmatobacter sp.]
MPRHLVCLTFDFDAMSGFIARGMTTPTPISRGEFGVVASARILDLMRRHGISTTWFIPGHTLETYPAACEAVIAAGHEVGHHGWTHQPPATLSPEQEEAGLVRANEVIRRMTGKPARGYRSPSWDLSPHTIALLIKHGFVYDTSMMGDDYTPYFARQGDLIELEKPAVLGAPSPLVELPISWSLDDYPHFEFVRTQAAILPGLQSAAGVLQNWIDDFTYLRRTLDWGVITYTFHPFVIGRGHRMMILERLIEAVRAGGAEFVTMEQAAREFLDRRR